MHTAPVTPDSCTHSSERALLSVMNAAVSNGALASVVQKLSHMAAPGQRTLSRVASTPPASAPTAAPTPTAPASQNPISDGVMP
jgi:hypothetical protein